jgi:hypothetical protein
MGQLTLGAMRKARDNNHLQNYHYKSEEEILS